MALIVGTNSWATVAEADSFLTDKIDAEEWFALTSSANPGERSKESLLVTAFSWLRGSPQLSIEAICTDDNVKNAQIEAAWFLQEYNQGMKDRQAMIASGVVIAKISRRTEHFNINNLGIPGYILGLLSEYQTGNVTVTLRGEYDA